jgi:hypothetical protein
MMRKSWAVIAGLVAVLGAACSDDEPTAPTGMTVVIYQNPDFRGDSRVVNGNLADLDDIPGCGGAGADWDDCISSINIPDGFEVTVFEHDQYSGASMVFTSNVADLEQRQGPCGGDWDDCISSIQVRSR